MSALDPQRPLQLRFKGDWGQANLTRICGWLASEVGRRAGAGSAGTIHTGRGMGDNLIALARGEVDVAIATPGSFARTARAGLGPFAGAPLPTLRAIGVVPHEDALLVALRADLGIATFAQLREQRPALRLALAPDDGESFMGIAAAAVLRASGVAPEQLLEWGGELIVHEHPSEALDEVARGNADGVIQEAIMTPWWRDLADAVDLAYLSLEADAEARLATELALPAMEVPAGYLRGIDAPVRAVDFRGWMVLAREDLRDDVAGLLAAILVESSDVLERQYRHLDPRYSPLSYPITPSKLASAPIPLHPGAEAYYRSAGALD